MHFCVYRLENKSVSKEDYFLSNQRNLITNRVAALETKMNNTDRKVREIIKKKSIFIQKLT